MLKYVALFFCAFGFSAAQAIDISGAGSTAAAPLYLKWQQAYIKKTGNKLAYEAIGSSGGIKKIKESSTDFGASDAPMSAADLKKFNLLDFPTVISGVVPIINLPGVKEGELRLTADLVVGMYSGKIEKWNDPAIARENPKLALPNLRIVPLARADGSGTTFTLTDYFSRVNPEWKQQYGSNFTIAWHADVKTIKGSTDLVALLKKTPGAIGYAEYAYVIENNLNYAQLKNREGQYVQPNAMSFKSALANSGWRNTGNFEEMLTDKPGSGSWPITGATYVYVPRVTSQPERTAAVIQFFTWAFMEGDEIANSLDYIRLPDNVQARVVHEISSVVDTKGNRLSIPILFK
ncbi:phosphate ABC transporter, phosphate-binding protein PstS [Collimonas arenae]|uniref:Phosphate-binding protein PstS n=1 Tax=Collimonas arenae TaxID=279058 RepID=A0A127QHQ1_9BURK|nr:phosphate ABC transporter substrate-binding protein PstS [Collimonas arenae]AMO99701.1 phosphate ABC transporter, phosphate-binding protein PstS [Collimonas arenae]AMP09600.1 phosphate ABC transporter, phosphate-binding protein PstS [Collimonas arenae]